MPFMPLSSSAYSPGEVLFVDEGLLDVFKYYNNKQDYLDFLATIGVQDGDFSYLDSSLLSHVKKEFNDNSIVIPGGANSNAAIVYDQISPHKAGILSMIHADSYGAIYMEALNNSTLRNHCLTAKEKGDTRTIHIAVAPDGARTMFSFNTAKYLFQDNNFFNEAMSHYRYVFMPMFLFYGETEKAHNYFSILKKVRERGKQSVLSLSSPNVVDLRRNMIIEHLPWISIMFGNIEEYKTLFLLKEASNLPQKLASLKLDTIFVVTQGEEGSYIITPYGKKRINIARFPAEAIDTTGAGDSYAGAFLAKFSEYEDYKKAGCYGSYAASKIITIKGARTDNAEVFKDIARVCND